MYVTNIADMVYSTDFIFYLIFLALAIWILMKLLFAYDNFTHSLLFAIISMIFVPIVITATEVGSAFVIALLVVSLLISQTMKWPITTSILMTAVALAAGWVLLPIF